MPAWIFVAEVASVEDDTTCTVRLGSGLELKDVRLRAVVNDEKTGILITPTVGSHVLVADFSGGQLTDMAVLQYSQVDKVTLNGGDLKGLVKIEELTKKLNNLVNWCKNHVHSGVITAVSGGVTEPAVGTPGNSAAPTTSPADFNKDDYEDTAVTH